MPWHLLSASDKRDSSQHPTEAGQASSPFPHPWEESPVTCYSSLKKLETLDMTKKVQRSPFHQEICYARQAEFCRLLSTSVSRVYANKKMIRKSKFAFFEPSGQLKLLGTFQAILPTPARCNGCTTQSSRCYLEILGVKDPAALVHRRAPLPGEPRSASSRELASLSSAHCSTRNAEITKGFRLPPLTQPVQKSSI